MDMIHKIVSWMTSPLGIFFLGLAAGGVLRTRSGVFRAPAWRRVGTWLMALAVVQLWVLSCDVTTRLVGVPLEDGEIAEERIGEGRADAIVLLGGGMGLHEKCGRAEISSGADRVWFAAKLWKKLAAQGGAGEAGDRTCVPLTVSGGGAAAELMFLRDMGVNPDSVLLISEAKNTEDEARLIKEALNAPGLRPPAPGTKPRILLVTSAWHMPRAKMLFERVGFEVTPAPTDYEMHYMAEEPLAVKNFFPNCDALQRNSAAIKEWVARACYWIKR